MVLISSPQKPLTARVANRRSAARRVSPTIAAAGRRTTPMYALTRSTTALANPAASSRRCAIHTTRAPVSTCLNPYATHCTAWKAATPG